MKLQRVFAIMRKEFIHIRRDKRSLIMAIAIPMLLLTLFGYALTLDVNNVSIIVWDQSETPDSRDLISRFTSSRYFSLRQYVHSYRKLEEGIDTNQVLMGLVIPRDFASQLKSNNAAQLQLIIDGSDANTATIALGYANGIIQSYSQQMIVTRFTHRGQVSFSPPLMLKPRVWFNADLTAKNYIIPGLIAVIMMVISALLTSLTVAREWERGTMEQLIATPIKGYELIIGKLVPYFTIGLFDVLLAVLMGEFLFQVPLRGSILFLFLMAAIFLIGALALGMLISINARNQLLASQMAMVLTFLPSFLLSGFTYAISNMPTPIQLVTHLIPARYFITLLKGIYLKGIGWQVLVMEVLFLLIFSTLLIIITILRFQKRLD
jgi:ABC-2 type transport system permease protein